MNVGIAFGAFVRKATHRRDTMQPPYTLRTSFLSGLAKNDGCAGRSIKSDLSNADADDDDDDDDDEK